MLAANVFYKGCQWAMLVVLAWFGAPEFVGQFVLSLAVTTPILAFFMLQLRMVQATDATGEYKFGDYFVLRAVTTLLAFVAIVFTAICSGYRPELVMIIVAVGLSACIDSFSDIIYGLLQQRERMDLIAKSMIIKGALSLAGLTVVFWATRQLLYGVLMIAAARLLVVLLCDISFAACVLQERSAVSGQKLKLEVNWQSARLMALAKLSLPLGFVAMLDLLCYTTPKYFVAHYWGEAAVGIFGALFYIREVGATAVLAIGQAAAPRLSQLFSSGRLRSYSQLLMFLVGGSAAIGGLMVLAAWLAGPIILRAVYGVEYAEHADTLVWVMIAAAVFFVALLNNFAMAAARCFRLQILVFAVVAVSSWIACYFLVPEGGLSGAAKALGVTSLTQILGQVIVIMYALRSQQLACQHNSVAALNMEGLC
ncbi:MAG: hypothetical protein KDA57_09700 [Planctomycetales bacterium]|nr:hypothetical protein [Planctomycetales bacterium]